MLVNEGKYRIAANFNVGGNPVIGTRSYQSYTPARSNAINLYRSHNDLLELFCNFCFVLMVNERLNIRVGAVETLDF